MTESADGTSDVAIVGYDGRFPGAGGPRAFWRNLHDGVHSIRQLSEDELERGGVSAGDLRNPHYVRAAPVLDDVELFDAAFFGISPREAEIMDPQQRLFLEVCWTALEHAGYDASGFTERVGVFAGARTNTYLLHLLRHPDLVESLGAFHLGLANDLGFMTTRVSHCLNLTGPSCAVQTACSTSLVAVHLAAQSLRAGECRIAVAGGAAIHVPHLTGYLAEEGSVFSPDGCCRVFDVSARGTVFGSGVAVVVLKLLAHARGDGDRIHAVIKGSAINNDGSAKASFTAPAVRGQVAVIEDALRNGRVTADTISYVEAHGTGTLLGDAIEVRALTRAWRKHTAAERYCALGSVKTNIGHLDAAAGVTGLIKVVECLTHERLVPTLHYEAPNPQITFEGSPFYVNTDVRPWPRGATPRRAAVSAFGVGGTNAHVIVEEAPARADSGASRPWQLLVWSGKTPEAAEAARQQLVSYLRDAAEAPLADIAYTLQTGRQRMPWRGATVCGNGGNGGDGDDMAAAAAAVEAGAIAEHAGDTGEDPSVVFVFPGQGAQHAGMGRELYEREPVFRAAIDACADRLTGEMGMDIRTAMYAESGPESGTARLDETWLAQPALFATEYALVKLWESWGIRPAAMLGHSLGEYVAACVSGVWPLEDALRLVARRGRLMQEMPRGAMAAVDLGEAEIACWLGDGVWLSAVNGVSACTIGGDAAAIERTERALRAAGHAAQRLRTSHAYHTPLMASMTERFDAEVRAVPCGAIRIPFISNLTGTWASDEEAADPGRWGHHTLAPVQFARGLETVMSGGERLVVEVGPGQALSRTIRRSGLRACASMGRAGQSDTQALVTALGHVWAAGAELDWRVFYAAEQRQRVPLPTYPFQRKRYWIDLPSASAAAGTAAASAPARSQTGRVEKTTDVTRWFWTPSWTLVPRVMRAARADRSGERWLLLIDEQGVGERLASRLRSAGADVVTVSIGSAWSRTDADTFVIDPNDPDHHRSLVEELRQASRDIERVVHLWGIVPPESAPETSQLFDTSQPASFYSLLHLMHELTASGPPALRNCWVIANDTQRVDDAELPRPAAWPAATFCKILAQETAVAARFVDVSLGGVSLGDVSLDDGSLDDVSLGHVHARSEAVPPARLYALVDRLLSELDPDASEPLVALRGGRRWRADYVPLPIEEDDASSPPPFPLRERGVYLITGGLGAVGGLIATQLAEQCQARLVLTSRTPRVSPEDWPADDAASRLVREIEAAGGEVRVVTADASDVEAMRAAVQTCHDAFDGLHGVIHAAGITSGESLFQIIRDTTPEHCEAQAHPKVHGLYAIEQAIRGLAVDFVLAMSSNAAVLGGLGFLSYAAANAAMDAFVTRRAREHAETRWISANWDHWPQETRKYLDVTTSMDEYAMTRDEARSALRMVLTRCEGGQVVVATGDLRRRLDLWVNRSCPETGTSIVTARAGEATLAPRPTLRTPYVAPRTAIESTIAGIWAAHLGVTPIGVDDDFFELGGHSLLAIQLIADIGSALDREVPLRALFEAPTVAQLAHACTAQVEHATAVE